MIGAVGVSAVAVAASPGPPLPPLEHLSLPTFGGLSIVQMLVAVGVLVVPALVLGHVLVLWAWRRGWEPHRLRNVAAVVWVGALVGGLLVGAVPWWGVEMFVSAVRQGWEGRYVSSAVNSMAATSPVVSVLAWWWWHGYCRSMRSGERHVAGERHVRRQQRYREADAARRVQVEPTPLTRTGRDGEISVVLGPRTETVLPHAELLSEVLLRRSERWLELPLSQVALHMGVVAQTGAGKTTLLERLSRGWAEAVWARYGQVPGSARPLVVFLGAKGGPGAAEDARAWAEAMEDLGLSADRVGVFPFESRLNMWRMDPAQVRASLHKLAKTDHRFYDVLQRGLLHLVVDAPKGPPVSSVEFLERLDRSWLARAWAGHPVEERAIAALTKNAGAGSGASALDADLMLFADLFRSLGADFDAGAPLSDFDALYVSVPGTTDEVVASAKTAVLIELLTYELGGVGGGGRRQALFVLDEFSAISGEVAGSVINLVERLRSLGGAVIVSAQSVEGLAPSAEERNRLLGSLAGGLLVGRTTNADELAARFGTRMVGEVGLQLVGAGSEDGAGSSLFSGGYSGAGTVRRQHVFLLDPNRVRQMPPHHVAWASPDKVVYGLVTPLGGRSRVLDGASETEEPVSGPVMSRRQLLAGQAAARQRRAAAPPGPDGPSGSGGNAGGAGGASDVWLDDIDGDEGGRR